MSSAELWLDSNVARSPEKVALEVERRGAFITVEDKGEEWRALREASPKRALTFAEAIAWLTSQEDAA